MAFLFASIMYFVDNAKAQTYEEMPIAVQKKMDDNKAKGLPSNSGIKVDYELTIEGVNDKATSAEFESILKKQCGLISFSYNSTNHHVIFTVPAAYNLDGMKSIIKGSKFGFGLFFKEIYHI